MKEWYCKVNEQPSDAKTAMEQAEFELKVDLIEDAFGWFFKEAYQEAYSRDDIITWLKRRSEICDKCGAHRQNYKEMLGEECCK